MKGQIVRGTPGMTPFEVVRSGGAGFTPGTPKNMSGTTGKQFQGTQVQNRENGATGTPYNSVAGNPGDAVMLLHDEIYGKFIVNGNQDMQDPRANGDGVVFDGVSRKRGYLAGDAETMDSPVPRGAPQFDTRTIEQENLAHLGQGIGAVPAMVSDDILAIGGVMSRGMQGTSTSAGGENELREDDTLRNMGPGGPIGPNRSAKDSNAPKRRER